jgi:N-acetylmuramoyl-L-alanine amidase
MGWAKLVRDGLTGGRTIAGAVLIAIAAGAIILSLGAGQSGAAAASERAAGVGEARQASLTVDLPAAFKDRIYGAPAARGRPIVVIDAGHGGRDPGARSVSAHLVEKDLSLALARELRHTLVERGRVRVAMTREDDSYLTLEERAGVARRLNAAMFVSVHVDSAPNPLARGASVYSLSDVASDAEAARFAAVENRGGIAQADGNGSVEAILSDLTMRAQMSASADLAARLVHKSAGRFELRPNPHRFAAFHVLKRSGAPAVLFEAGYLSNIEDESLLRSPEHRSAIVLALAQAIEADVAARSRH